MHPMIYRNLTIFSGFWLALLALPASAELYKCPMDSGGYQYSSEPCPGALRQDGDAWIDVEAEQRQLAEQNAIEESARQAAAQEQARLRENQRVRDEHARGMAEAQLRMDVGQRKFENYLIRQQLLNKAYKDAERREQR